MVLNTAQPIILFLLLIATVLLIYLGYDLKKSYIVAIPLVGYVVLLIVHVFEILTLSIQDVGMILTWCIVSDCAFICLALLSYLWIDDIDAKVHNKKSVDDSLDWFWKKV